LVTKLWAFSRAPNSPGSALEVSTTAGGADNASSRRAMSNPASAAGLTSTTATSGRRATAAAIA
jgi:hypothetical protein